MSRRSQIIRPEMILPDDVHQKVVQRRIRQHVDSANALIDRLRLEAAVLRASEESHTETTIAAIVTAFVSLGAAHHLAEQLKCEREAYQSLYDRLAICRAKAIDAHRLILEGHGHRGRKLAMAAVWEFFTHLQAVDPVKEGWGWVYIYRDESVAHDEGERYRLAKIFEPKKGSADRYNYPVCQLCYRAWVGKAVQAVAASGVKVEKAKSQVAGDIKWIGDNPHYAQRLGGVLSKSVVGDMHERVRENLSNDPIAQMARGIPVSRLEGIS